MNKLKSAAIGVFFTASAVMLAAQAAPAVQKELPSLKHSKSAVTVSGCVANGQKSGEFILTSAALVPDPTPSATGTSGTASDAPIAMERPSTYTLTGENVKGHLGHKVELTGTSSPNAAIADASATAKAPATTTADAKPTTTDAATAATPGYTFDVKSVKMISTTCS